MDPIRIHDNRIVPYDEFRYVDLLDSDYTTEWFPVFKDLRSLVVGHYRYAGISREYITDVYRKSDRKLVGYIEGRYRDDK